ncbi:glycosyltransferase family 4 protein [Sphingobacterium sp. xlx-130]|uniref:glycosyltransferase family 4 protein n=1 Tax=Sphingobacterium sp. xlx-130 TaxID=2654323 RepID=UPI0013DA8C75|nr:glycosyltransferase family 1 protein [Sphingobacterium sp. xlx-130]
MRIGFDAKRYFLNRTGLGNYSRDLIRILEQYYPENNYIKYTPKIDEGNLYTKALRITTKLPTGTFNKLFPSLWRNRRIIEDLKCDKIEIFHGLSGEIPVGLRQAKIKSVVTIHDLIFLKFPKLYSHIDRYIYNKKFKYAVNHADKIIAISEQTKNDIVAYYGISAEKIDVIYQGCHPAFKIPKTAVQKEEIRNKLDLPERFLLNVGSIEPRKNAFSIVKAIEHLDIPLVLVGKGTKYADEIKKYVSEKGLNKKVLFLQGLSMEELSIIYTMADIFIYPSIYEGFGIPIIEALYSGVPVIATNSGVFPEAGGPFSYYIDPKNIEEMQHAINSILDNQQIRNEMIENGLKYVQRFNDEVIAEKWNTLYTSFLMGKL